MVNAAVYILKMPCLWNLSPPAFNGPTPFPTNTTYLERAQAYVAAGDNVIDSELSRHCTCLYHLADALTRRLLSQVLFRSQLGFDSVRLRKTVGVSQLAHIFSHRPNDTRWSLVGDIGNQIGEPMPWNRRMIVSRSSLAFAGDAH